MSTDAITHQYGLIGYPLGHSFSKQFFDEKFKKENIQNCSFNLYPIKEIEGFIDLLQQHKNLKGIAVTIPHKQSIMPLLDSVSEAAKEIGAVNCVQIIKGRSIGFNTDVVGFKQSLQPLLQPQHTSAIVLGTGGASKAVQYVLKKLGIAFILVSTHANKKNNSISYEKLRALHLQNNTLIINTTPLGMTPNEGTFPVIDYTKLTPQHLCYDLVYKPEKTMFLQKAAYQGAVVKNGFEMLILQAQQNWKIWNS